MAELAPSNNPTPSPTSSLYTRSDFGIREEGENLVVSWRRPGKSLTEPSFEADFVIEKARLSSAYLTQLEGLFAAIPEPVAGQGDTFQPMESKLFEALAGRGRIRALKNCTLGEGVLSPISFETGARVENVTIKRATVALTGKEVSFINLRGIEANLLFNCPQAKFEALNLDGATSLGGSFQDCVFGGTCELHGYAASADLSGAVFEPGSESLTSRLRDLVVCWNRVNRRVFAQLARPLKLEELTIIQRELNGRLDAARFREIAQRLGVAAEECNTPLAKDVPALQRQNLVRVTLQMQQSNGTSSGFGLDIPLLAGQSAFGSLFTASPANPPEVSRTVPFLTNQDALFALLTVQVAYRGAVQNGEDLALLQLAKRRLDEELEAKNQDGTQLAESLRQHREELERRRRLKEQAARELEEIGAEIDRRAQSRRAEEQTRHTLTTDIAQLEETIGNTGEEASRLRTQLQSLPKAEELAQQRREREAELERAAETVRNLPARLQELQQRTAADEETQARRATGIAELTQQLQAANGELQELTRRKETLEASRQRAETDRDELDRQIQALHTEEGQGQGRLDELSRRLEQLQREAQNGTSGLEAAQRSREELLAQQRQAEQTVERLTALLREQTTDERRREQAEREIAARLESLQRTQREKQDALQGTQRQLQELEASLSRSDEAHAALLRRKLGLETSHTEANTRFDEFGRGIAEEERVLRERQQRLEALRLQQQQLGHRLQAAEQNKPDWDGLLNGFSQSFTGLSGEISLDTLRRVGSS